MPVTIYTDGSYKILTGVGGWGAVIIGCDGTQKNIKGYCEDSTSLRMEMIAIINALKYLPCPCTVMLYTDCKHIEHCVTNNLPRWKATGWKTIFDADVCNRDLWEAIDFQCNVHTVIWHWLPGHAGNRYNERADRLAHEGRRYKEKRRKRKRIRRGKL